MIRVALKRILTFYWQYGLGFLCGCAYAGLIIGIR